MDREKLDFYNGDSQSKNYQVQREHGLGVMALGRKPLFLLSMEKNYLLHLWCTGTEAILFETEPMLFQKLSFSGVKTTELKHFWKVSPWSWCCYNWPTAPISCNQIPISQ